MTTKPLPPEVLHRRCPELPFETTASLPEEEVPLGQDRALDALELGLGLDAPGYNIFVLGPPGVGKRTVSSRVLRAHAANATTPDDWCYLNNFIDAQRPRALQLPAGRGVPFKRDMERLIDELRSTIPAVFESEDYRTRLQILDRQLAEKRDGAMRVVQNHAGERHVTVVRMPMGLAVAPTSNGEVLDAEQFSHLPPPEQERIQKDIATIQEELQAVLRGMPQLEREHHEKVKELNRETALFAVGHLIDELRGRYAQLPQVIAHLNAVQADVIENVHEFLGSSEPGDAASHIRKLLSESPAFRRYGVNLIVDNGETRGAPVVHEDLPTYANLMGRVEHHAHLGMLITDFTLVRPGALHRANGGYLVLDARKLIAQPFAWESMKRALDARQIRIDPPERLYGFTSTASLEPEPIPLRVKVVLIGERWIHALLAVADPEFHQHFKVAADFEDDVERDGNEERYARLVAALARAQLARPFSREAVSRIVEQAARLACDAAKLTANVQSIADLVREANYCAAVAGHERVEREEVQAALDAQLRRQDRLRQVVLEQIARGTLLIDTAGEQVAQVNGLSVIQAGQFAFGRPSRITARVRLGKGEVVDIEREVELGGPIHSKGVLILAGYLAARYTANGPFPLSASLVFEQSYGGVDGDSASSAELYALLSALSELAIRQAIAVTGSVNQLGQVQAIGGVNEKIEGFFDVCRARGLTGSQGVMIPAANTKHLMLREDVVAACAARQFHVFAVKDVDEGIEILTGVPAGSRGTDGRYPAGSVNARVAARIEEFARTARALAAPPPTPGVQP
ncbi:MAG TPA: AAA family ATPase [Anaeromyxobacteraceae bacterium]|nr:AAA family ATPase [Anaeromyxobacteraceae bacterium]